VHTPICNKKKKEQQTNLNVDGKITRMPKRQFYIQNALTSTLIKKHVFLEIACNINILWSVFISIFHAIGTAAARTFSSSE
jgi:hypothetical protein